MQVQAVGTAFDVRRYRDQSEIGVTEGVVKVWSVAAGGEPVIGSGRATRRSSALIDARARGRLSALSILSRCSPAREGLIVLDDVTLAAAA